MICLKTADREEKMTEVEKSMRVIIDTLTLDSSIRVSRADAGDGKPPSEVHVQHF